MPVVRLFIQRSCQQLPELSASGEPPNNASCIQSGLSALSTRARAASAATAAAAAAAPTALVIVGTFAGLQGKESAAMTVLDSWESPDEHNLASLHAVDPQASKAQQRHFEWEPR